MRLKNGGFVRGELMEVDPQKSARVRLADSSVREIPWIEIASIDEPTKQAPTPATNDVPKLTLNASTSSEIVQLRNERDQIDNTGPAVMMIVGGGTFLLIGLPGLGLLAAGEICADADFGDGSSAEADCSDVSVVGGVMTMIGVVGGVVGVWGLIKILGNNNEEERLNHRIRELQASSRLDFDLRPRGQGAELVLRAQF